ncbi:MAG TPA: hypothetical protein VEJ36_05175 [Nitrososphaerales archaeon]|nr:hypothetical protein [Nitrososphaerales archaeon]
MGVDPIEVCNLLTKFSGVNYDIGQPPGELQIDAEWFVWCPNLRTAAETSNVWAVWLDKRGDVNAVSPDLGDVTTWIEDSYGEEGAAKTVDLNLMTLDDVASKLGKDFPLLLNRLNSYERVVYDTATKTGTGMTLTGENYKGGYWFRLNVRIAQSKLETFGLGPWLERTLSALKLARSGIGKADSEGGWNL